MIIEQIISSWLSFGEQVNLLVLARLFSDFTLKMVSIGRKHDDVGVQYVQHACTKGFLGEWKRSKEIVFGGGVGVPSPGCLLARDNCKE